MGNLEMNAQEERELTRVFDMLANYLPKSKIMKELQPKLDRKSTIHAHKKSAEAIKVYDQYGNIMTEDQIDEELELLEEEIEVLQAEITKFNSQAGKKIHPADINETLKRLGKKMSKKDIEEMIWEVDEDLDGCVNWLEFKLMFLRNITDTSGMEPYSLFNVVQFMMYDKDASGTVTVDETMSMLYARYGRDQLEHQMKELFGEDLKTADGDGQLSFEEYLQAVRVRIIPEPQVSNPMPTKGGKSRSKKR